MVQSPYDMDQLEGDDLATDLALLKAGIIQAQARADAVAELITHKLKSGEAIDGPGAGGHVWPGAMELKTGGRRSAGGSVRF